MRMITCLIAALLSATAMANDYDLIIRNGRVVDGAGNPWTVGDLAVKDGRIAVVGHLDRDATAPRVIDATGLYVTPGFIDVHTHCEDDLFKSPPAENFVRMGVSTVVSGNCGDSYTDLREAFTSHTTQGMGVNFASHIGHNPIRRMVMGNVDRDPSTTEIQEMRRLVRKGMEDGAIGFSTGLIYTPGIYAKTPELIELAREAASLKGIYASHIRGEGDSIFKAIAEALTIGREAHIPVQISHFKISSPRYWGASTQTVQMVEQAREGGLDVTVDQYLYTASSSSAGIMLPNWANEGTTTDILARIRNPETRKRIIAEVIKERRDDSGRKDMSYARIANFRADTSLNGMNLLEVAKRRKNSDTWEAQAETLLDIITSGGARMVFHSIDENDVRYIAQYPNTMFASDSGIRLFGQDTPHPRGYGNCARALAKYVRDDKVLRLEDAIRRMTSLPAQRMGLSDRGLLRPGMAADIAVFDLAKVKDASTYESPHAYSQGFAYVLVNGTPVLNEGIMTGAMPGKVLYGPARRR